MADLYEAAGAARRVGELIAGTEHQTQVRWQTMYTIAAQRLTVPQVARRMGVSRQNVQRVVGDLERDGLVRFEANPDHRTSPLLVLTEEGQPILDRLNAAAAQAHQVQLEWLPEAEVEATRQALRQLTATLQRYEAFHTEDQPNSPEEQL
ncbi:MarR family winged helix-turn-helix transcriptional regulator [Deinococcus arboris]|nr:MarR family transcriptional regulator [Deinococcus arboris]